MHRSMLRLGTLILLSVVVLVVGACALFDNRHPAIQTVDRMYAALSEGDLDAYMDEILPENREQASLWGLLGALELNIGFFGVNLGDLTRFSVRDLDLEIITSTEDYALVQAKGRFRYPLLMMETSYCDQHDVRLQDDTWYVDAYAAEREERLLRVLEARQRDAAQQTSVSSQANPFAFSMEGMFDFCP